jgi:hypothetical protein
MYLVGLANAGRGKRSRSQQGNVDSVETSLSDGRNKPKMDESKVADQMKVFTPNFIATSVSFPVNDDKWFP